MRQIYCLMGKSSSGKDTIYNMLRAALPFSVIVPYTTRPIRDGEQDGETYHFVTEEDVDRYEKEGKIIELRAYHTVHGIWKYLTVDDGQVNLREHDYLVIGTVEAYQKLSEYYGKDKIVPIYIEVDDGIRLQRALDREKKQENPKYAEMCRRFLADAEDFSDEKLQCAGITKRFANLNLEQTKDEILAYIESCKMSR